MEWVAGDEGEGAGRVGFGEAGVDFGTVTGCGVKVGKVMCGKGMCGSVIEGREP